MVDVYQQVGYKNREEYLHSLAERFKTTLEVVRALANYLGEDEDFDELICVLKDMSWLTGKGSTEEEYK